jgi:LacI family transcriptional regulator
MMIDSRVDGVLVVMPPKDSALFLKCESQHIPVVSVLRDPAESSYSVNSDDYAGGRLATEHLIGLGHRRIAHLVGDPSVTTTKHRLRGYRDALANAGLPHDPSLEIPAGFTNQPGREATHKLLHKNRGVRPTAIFACNDLCAAGAMLALKEAGLSIPKDVAIVGYDDTPFCESVHPALTSVRMPIEQMGTLASRILISLVEKVEVSDPQPILPISLTIRQSCGAASASDAAREEASRPDLR